MKITKRQLRRIIREAEGSTKKYDDDSALKGDQSKLPDGLQKGIIDKTVEDRDEREEEERKEKNESTQIIKRQLRRTIREMMRGPAAEMAAAAAESGAAGMAHHRGDLGKNIADVDFPIIVSYEGKSEIAYNQDELDDILDYVAPTHGSSGIPYSLDSISDLEPSSTPLGAEIEQLAAGKKMKITKRQLRRIIKEYATSLRKEPMTPDYVYNSMAKNKSVRTGIPFMTIAMNSIVSGDFLRASNAVMDALMIDDPPAGAEEELNDLLSSARTEDDLVSAAATWGTRHFRT